MNKRLDLGGPLLAGLFRNLFRKVVKDVRGAVQRAVDKGEMLFTLPGSDRHPSSARPAGEGCIVPQHWQGALYDCHSMSYAS